MGTPWWQHLCCTVVTRRVWQPWVPHVNRLRLLGRPLPMAPVLWQISTPIFGAVVWPFSNPKTKTLKALEHLSWMTFQPLCWPMLTLLPSPHRAMLWYAAECGQRLFESSKVHAPRSFKVWQLLWQRWQNTACTTSRQTKKRISKRRKACWSPAKLCTWFKTLQSSEPSPLPAQ